MLANGFKKLCVCDKTRQERTKLVLGYELLDRLNHSSANASSTFVRIEEIVLERIERSDCRLNGILEQQEKTTWQ